MRYLALLILVLAAPALADGPTLKSTGSATREALPDTMRAVTHVVELGNNLQAAMAAATQRAAVMQKGLQALSPAKLTLGPPRLATTSALVNQKLARAIKRLKQIKSGGADEQVTVTIGLTGEWPLTGPDPAAQLVASAELSRKIASVARSAHTTDGEAEKDDEESDASDPAAAYAAELATRTGAAGKPGTVTTMFFRRIPRELIDEMCGEAFKTARESAQRLAGTAGHDLGPLQSLATTGVSGGDDDDTRNYYAAMRAGGEKGFSLPAWEVSVGSFTTMRLRVDVETTWAIKPR